jgi:hypothetical protein
MAQFEIKLIFIFFPGAVPFPLLFGLMFDQVCLVWQEICGDEKGSCWIYDNQSFATRLMYTVIAVKTLSTLSFITAFLVYKPPKSADTSLTDTETDSEVISVKTVTNCEMTETLLEVEQADSQLKLCDISKIQMHNLSHCDSKPLLDNTEEIRS